MSNHRQHQDQLELFDQPADPARWQAEYHRIRAELRRTVVGHTEAVDRLAIIGTQHLMGRTRQRVLLVGPSGVGKTTLARALAAATGVDFAIISVPEIAETNWAGRDLRDAIGELAARVGGDAERLARAVIVLDELDKVATGRHTGAGADYRLGKQQSMLDLLGGAEVHYRDAARYGKEAVWRADRALIVMAGVFEGLAIEERAIDRHSIDGPSSHRERRQDPDLAIAPADLIRLGLMRELVERLGSIIRLAPLDARALVEVLRRGIEPAGATYRDLGYRLEVPAATLAWVAAAVRRGAGLAGPRTGVGWLEAAAQRVLVRLLNDGAPPGTRHDLAPDDIALPRGAHRDPPGAEDVPVG